MYRRRHLLIPLLATLLLWGACSSKPDAKPGTQKTSHSGTLVADRSGAPLGARTAPRRPGQAEPLKVLGSAILTIGEKYVAPQLIDPKKMFDKAMEFVEAERAEIRITGSARKGQVTAQVGDRRRTFHLGSLSSVSMLYTELKRVLGWVRGALKAEADITPRQLAEVEYAAVNGLVSTLDPHTVLMPPKIYDEMRIRTRGAFGGIGIVISIRDGALTVISPIDGTPAARVGIRAGDRIVKIEDESTVNMPLNDAVDRLRGKPGTPVAFWVEREGWPEARRFRIVRERIEIKSVESRVLPGRVGYVRINRFSHNTTDELKKSLAKLKKADVKGLVLDLWNNPGGLLQQAERVADLFLSKGDIVITEAARHVVLRVRKATPETTLFRRPIIVLVNRGSASAAEIVAGALKNQGRALVMGETTYGKGTVQMLFENDDGSALKMTVAQYLTPGSVSIQGVGVVPDVMTNAVLLRKDWTRMFGHEADARRRAKRKDLLPARSQHPQRPKVQLNYLSPENDKSKKNQPARYSVSENAADPPVVELARQLLARYGGPPVSMLRAAKTFLKDWSQEQQRRIITALAVRHVDWSAQPPEVAARPDAQLRVDAAVRPSGPAKAGDTIRLRVRVTNQGSTPIYRLRGRTSAPAYFLDERELLFGKLAPGASHQVELKVKIPSYSRTAIQPVRFLLRSPSVAGTLTKRLRLRVQGMPRPRFHLAYRVHDDVKGNGNGRPEPGETVRLQVKVKNVGAGPMKDGTVALRNLTGHGLNVLKGRQAVKTLRPGATATADFTFAIAPTLHKKTMTLELSVYDSRVRAGLQEHLHIPLAPATASAPGLVGSVTPPEIQLQKVPLVVTKDTTHLEVQGEARDDHNVKDLFIEVSNYDAEQIRNKVFYKAAPHGQTIHRLSFKSRVPLWKGLNTILIVARENGEVMGFKRVVVLRPE